MDALSFKFATTAQRDGVGWGCEMRGYRRADLERMIRVCADANGGRVRERDLRERFGVSGTPFRRVFGSLGRAVRVVLGGDGETGRDDEGRLSREGILSMAREVIEPGEEISLGMFCRRAGVSSPSVYKYWGSWPALREAAGGCAPRPARQFSRAGILDSFRAVVAEHGDVSLDEFQKLAGVSRTTVLSYWRWRELRREVGLRPRRYGGPQLDDDELIDDYLRIWKRLGRRPTRVDIHVMSQFSYDAYQRRWHNARAIAEAFDETCRRRAEFLDSIRELVRDDPERAAFGSIDVERDRPRPPVVCVKRMMTGEE